MPKPIVRRRNIKADAHIQVDRITVDSALERVLNIYSAENRRNRTMKDYAAYWEQFFRVVPRKYLDEVTPDDFRTFINVLLRKRGLSAVTVNVRLNGIRAMFNRLFDEGYIETNPVSNIRKLKTDEQPVRPLSDEQLKRLFAQVDKQSFAGYRDYCAMLTIVRASCRINEINSLEITDLDFENRVIMLPGSKNKNRKNRAVPLSEDLIRELQQLISETREYFGAGVKHVFVNNRGERLQEDLLRKRMHKYAKQSGLNKECRCSPHSLRHSFAVRSLKNGMDIRTLAKIMGHSDLNTTKVYLNYTNEDIREQFDKAASRDTLKL